MTSNIDKIKSDLARLQKIGTFLDTSIKLACEPASVKRQIQELLGDKAEQYINDLPDFQTKYQSWYSEGKAVIKQLLPDRYLDFCKHYETPKQRKEISYANYVIEDYLQGLVVSRGSQVIVNHSAAIPRFAQQLAILDSANARFESALFDLRSVVQADLFDGELDAAAELLKHKFLRASGAVAGVVLERHLKEICANRSIKIIKKTPCISDYNDALKSEEIIDMPTWRYIQHLGDIRNTCDHSKDVEPTKEQVGDLIEGCKKIIKSVF